MTIPVSLHYHIWNAIHQYPSFLPKRAKAVLIFNFLCNGSRKIKGLHLFYRLRFNSLFYHFLFCISSPILSSLSSATVKSINLSEAPMTSAIPDSIFYYNFNGHSFQSQLGKTVSYNCTNSFLPQRFRPYISITLKKLSTSLLSCLRHTGWIWYLLKEFNIVLMLYNVEQTEQSNHNAMLSLKCSMSTSYCPCFLNVPYWL
jgi:hypothetical protein